MSHSSRPNYLNVFYKFLTRPKVDPLALSNINKSVMGFNLIYLWDRPDELKRMSEKILSMNLDKPYIGKEFSFHNLIKALKIFSNRKEYWESGCEDLVFLSALRAFVVNNFYTTETLRSPRFTQNYLQIRLNTLSNIFPSRNFRPQQFLRECRLQLLLHPFLLLRDQDQLCNLHT